MDKKEKTETFFADAFCAKSAKILSPSKVKELNLKIGAVVEIDSPDRGIFYIAHLIGK